MNVKKSIIGGVFWTTLETVINRGFGLIIQFVLARLLFPEDYGLVGMAVVFIAFLEVFNDLGMNAALIQRKEEKLTPLHFDTAFWTGMVWGFLLYLLMIFVGTPLIADFYGEGKLRMIIPIMSLSLLINPVNLVHQAQLIKAMDFEKLALINNVGNIISGIFALLLAYLGMGVWALVFYSLIKVVVALPLYFKATNWFPKLNWKREMFDDIFGFGVYTTGTNFFNKLTGNIDMLLIGKLVGSAALGFYSFAYLATNIVRDQIVAVVNKVLYPVYTKMQDDKKKMLELFLKIISINNFVVYPLILGLYLFAEFLIPSLFGSKWDNAIPLIKILSVAVMIQMLNNSHTTLFRAAGEVRLEFTLQVIKSVAFFVPLITLGVYYYGVEGAAYGFAIATFLSVVLSFYFMNKVFGLRLIHIFKALKVSLVMAAFCWITTEILKTFADWRLCLLYFLVSVTVIYLTLGKSLVTSFWEIIKNPRAVIKDNK